MRLCSPQWLVIAAMLGAVAAVPARADLSAEELAKLAQNPVGNLISLPFQNNTNFNFGPEKGTQNILNIQPVIPISIDSRLEHHHADNPAGDLAAVARARRQPHERHRRSAVDRVPLTGESR